MFAAAVAIVYGKLNEHLKSHSNGPYALSLATSPGIGGGEANFLGFNFATRSTLYENVQAAICHFSRFSNSRSLSSLQRT